MKKASLQSIRNLLTITYPNVRQKQANKLWWRKYPYRLAYRVDRVSEYHPVKEEDNYERYQKFSIRLETFKADHPDIKTRDEWSWKQIYTTELNDFIDFLDMVKDDEVTEILDFNYLPEDVDLEAIKNTIFCNHLPHHEYKFKVIFNSAAGQDGQKFVNWIDKYEKPYQTNPYNIPEGVRYNLVKYNNTYNGYMYVRDDKHLHLLSFRAAEVIKRIEEFKVR